MSTKYEDLQEDYREEIERIRRLAALADKASKAVNDHEKAAPSPHQSDDLAIEDHYIAGQELFDGWQEAKLSLAIECERLGQEIEAEYQDVPFSKAKNQGIEKFWELVGI